MDSPAFRCVRCSSVVRLRQAPGRTHTYRIFPALTVPESVQIPTCSRCAATFVDGPTAEALVPVLQAEYKRELSRRAKRALAEISPYLSQRKLERRIDMTQGYLSRIGGGHQTPSPQLVVLLALLAHDPALLEWVALYWAAPSPPDPQPEPSR